MNTIVINQEAIFAQLPDGKLVRFEDQEGTKRMFRAFPTIFKGTFSKTKIRAGQYELPPKYEIVIQWQARINEKSEWKNVKMDWTGSAYQARQVARLVKRTEEISVGQSNAPGEISHYNPERPLASKLYEKNLEELVDEIEEVNSAHGYTEGSEVPEPNDDLDFELLYCTTCVQMTNHKNGKCLKCKPLTPSPVETGEESDEKNILDKKISEGIFVWGEAIHLKTATIFFNELNNNRVIKWEGLSDGGKWTRAIEAMEEYASLKQSSEYNRALEDAIKKWQLLLASDRDKDITYGRGILLEMFNDFKSSLKTSSQDKQ